MKLGAYTITVEVEGRALDEHQVENKGNEISCWIASEEGKCFQVHIQQERREDTQDSIFPLFLDGASEAASRRILPKKKTSAVSSGRMTSSSETVPFQFKSIVTTDEETIEASNVSESFGSIKLEVHLGSRGARTRVRPVDASASNLSFNELLVKKQRVSHVCGFGEAITSVNYQRDYKYQDPLRVPLFVFNFKYRSRSLLQAMEIIPVSPAPASPPQNAIAGPSQLLGNSDIINISSGDESDDDETVRTLKAALAKAKTDARAAKALRRRSQIEPEDVKPKLERGDDDSVPRPSKKAKLESEVIELSD